MRWRRENEPRFLDGRITLNPSHSPVPQIPHRLAQRWGITPIDYLGARYNQHWLVESRGSRLVLRGYNKEPFDDIAYELEVLRRLLGLGWPVPAAAEEPILVDGRTWCLFTWLPAASPPSTDSSAERRARGRLLAQLHESTASLVGMGQRRGASLSHEVVRDPELIALVREYERIYPAEGQIMGIIVNFSRVARYRALTLPILGAEIKTKSLTATRKYTS